MSGTLGVSATSTTGTTTTTGTTPTTVTGIPPTPNPILDAIVNIMMGKQTEAMLGIIDPHRRYGSIQLPRIKAFMTSPEQAVTLNPGTPQQIEIPLKIPRMPILATPVSLPAIPNVIPLTYGTDWQKGKLLLLLQNTGTQSINIQPDQLTIPVIVIY